MSTLKSAKPYHHGDLQAALVTAGLALLEEAGEAGLSLRAAARRAGVSAMAPYRHFPDKAALLAAIAARGFDALADRLEAADAGADGHAAMAAQGAAYVAFAMERPALFRLMFGPRGPGCPPEFEAASNRAYAALATRAASLAGAMPAEDVALACWSLVHGLAGLIIDGRVPLTGEAAQATAERIAQSFSERLSSPRPTVKRSQP